MRAAPVHLAASRAPREGGVGAPGSGLQAGSHLVSRGVGERGATTKAPRPRRQLRSEAVQHVGKLLIHVVGAQQRSVRYDAAVKQAAVASEEHAVVRGRPRCQVCIVGFRLVRRVDAEQTQPSGQ